METAPFFLVALPQVLDPFFHRSVVLVLAHQPEGSFGLIINRPTEIELARVLERLHVAWGGPANAVTWFGGPVEPSTGTALFDRNLTDLTLPDGAVIEIGPGLSMSQNLVVMASLAASPPERFKLLVGYAGWSAGQLDEEIGRNDWLVTPLDANLALTSDHATIWNSALDSIGVREESLSTLWSQSTGDEEPN